MSQSKMMEKIIMKSDDIISIRKKLGVSRKELAEFMEIPYETLCRWENGKRSPSKFYENQLLKLSGNIELKVREEKLIFTDSNLQHIKEIVSQKNDLVFGTLHALTDDSESVLLVEICVRLDVHILDDLGKYLNIQKTSPTNIAGQVIGFFVATDKRIRPANQMEAFMCDKKKNYCVTYDITKENFAVWKLYPHRSSRLSAPCVRPLPYLVVK